MIESDDKMMREFLEYERVKAELFVQTILISFDMFAAINPNVSIANDSAIEYKRNKAPIRKSVRRWISGLFR